MVAIGNFYAQIVGFDFSHIILLRAIAYTTHIVDTHTHETLP